jgi:hypothetical protein
VREATNWCVLVSFDPVVSYDTTTTTATATNVVRSATVVGGEDVQMLPSLENGSSRISILLDLIDPVFRLCAQKRAKRCAS